MEIIKPLNSSLASKGDFELLCYATSTGDKTVPNLTKYKSVLAVLLIDGTAYGTSLIPVSLFKTIESSRCSYYDASGQYKCDYKYVDDTTINVSQINTNKGCYIYGVK